MIIAEELAKYFKVKFDPKKVVKKQNFVINFKQGVAAKMNQKYEELKNKYGRVGENKIMSYDIPNLNFLFELNSASDDYLLSVL